jgi:hypothetical protein
MRTAFPASLVCAAMTPAHAGLLTYQGVTFNSSWAGNVLTLEIDAAGRKDAWAGATGLAALELDGIGSYTSVSVAGMPNGAAGWTTSGSELNAQGCSGRTNGQAGSRLCFYGQQIALADDMVFSFTFNGNAVRPVEPHLKVAFVDSKGKNVGGLLSQTLPASPGTGSQSGNGGSSNGGFGTPTTPGTGAGSGGSGNGGFGSGGSANGGSGNGGSGNGGSGSGGSGSGGSGSGGSGSGGSGSGGSGSGGSGTPATPGTGSGSGGTVIDAPNTEIPPLADQAHDEPTGPTAGSDTGTQNGTEVPEPQSIALLLAGLGLMGASKRRKPRA